MHFYFFAVLFLFPFLSFFAIFLSFFSFPFPFLFPFLLFFRLLQTASLSPPSAFRQCFFCSLRRAPNLSNQSPSALPRCCRHSRTASWVSPTPCDAQFARHLSRQPCPSLARLPCNASHPLRFVFRSLLPSLKLNPVHLAWGLSAASSDSPFPSPTRSRLPSSLKAFSIPLTAALACCISHKCFR